ncbi:MAG: hypothetical protein JWQ51_1769 [Tardiphaga sp.]|nr:hypothetical protein [Tardiphaga sp.]MDB5629429.1 hypothetical protein [Tardiphaga sp.]
MIRPVMTEVGIFLIPFALYAIWLVANRSGVFQGASWPAQTVAKLVFGSLLLTILSFILLAHFSGAAPHSTYTPARVDDQGNFIPGSEK